MTCFNVVCRRNLCLLVPGDKDCVKGLHPGSYFWPMVSCKVCSYAVVAWMQLAPWPEARAVPRAGIQQCQCEQTVEQEWRRLLELGERMELWPSVVYPEIFSTARRENEMCQEMPGLLRTQTFWDCSIRYYWSHLQLSLPAVPVYLKWSNNCSNPANVILAFLLLSQAVDVQKLLVLI